MARSRRKPARTKPWVVFLIILLIMLVCALFIYVFSLKRVSVLAPTLVQDPNVRIGSLEEDPIKRQEELDAIADESKISYSINVTPSFQNGSAEGNMMLENPSDNGNRLTVELFLGDTGELIYQSGYMDPGQYIEKVKLKKALPQGTYKATAFFYAYRLSDNSYLGKTAVELTLYILE